jgi:hypothetical protein
MMKKPRFIGYGLTLLYKQLAEQIPIWNYVNKGHNSAVHVYCIRNGHYAHVVVKSGCITISDLPF